MITFYHNYDKLSSIISRNSFCIARNEKVIRDRGVRFVEEGPGRCFALYNEGFNIFSTYIYIKENCTKNKKYFVYFAIFTINQDLSIDFVR